jgi:zinc transporter ZupT
MTETYSTTSHSGPEPSKSIAEHLAQVLVLTGIPCGCMVFGAILVQFWQPGPKFRSACQHFSSGILLAAISCELMPEIIDRVNETKHQGYQYPHFFFLFGFVAGFMFLLGLGRFMGYITGQAGGHSHGHHAEPEPIEPIDVQPSFDALNNPVGSPRTTRRFDSSATLGEKSSLVAHEGQPPDVVLYTFCFLII